MAQERLDRIHAILHEVLPGPTPVPVQIAALPKPPTAYTITSGALPITTKDQLLAALSSTAPKDWVVEDGIYDAGPIFLNDINGHRLQSRNLGKAILKNGMQVGGNWGPGGRKLQGFHFDIIERSRTPGGAGHVLNVWDGQTGSAADTGIKDCTFNGNKIAASAIWITTSKGGAVVQRIRAWDFTDYGVGAAGPTEMVLPVLFEDIDVRRITRAVPKSAGGTAEAALWAGQRGVYRRVYTEDTAWMGIWTGGKCTDSVLEDLTVRGTSIAIYPEHKTTRTTFRRFDLEVPQGKGRGITCEWYDVFGPGNGSTNDSIFEDGVIKGGHIGLAWNAGCKRNVAQRIKFIGQTIAAIEDLDDEPTTNKYINNNYSQLAVGAVPVSRTLHNF